MLKEEEVPARFGVLATFIAVAVLSAPTPGAALTYFQNLFGSSTVGTYLDNCCAAADTTRHAAFGDYIGSSDSCDSVATVVGTATLIEPHWLLTAAHAAEFMRDRKVTFSDGEHQIVDVVLHWRWRCYRWMQRWLRAQPPLSLVSDVALVRVEPSVTDVQPMPLYRDRDEVGQVTVLVGRGATGDGQVGSTQEDGLLRAATNQIEEADDRWLHFKFDAPPSTTDLEGVAGDGDSGGPALIEIDGRFHVAGVSSYQDSDPSSAGRYGVRESYVRISSHADWIERRVLGPK